MHTYAVGTWYPILTVTNASGSTTSPVIPARTLLITAGLPAISSKIGLFRPTNGQWSLDSNGNYTWDGSDTDFSTSWGLRGDTPIIGDWNGDGKDDIGIFRPTFGIWGIDSNGNRAWEVSDTSLNWGVPNDKPVVGKY